MPDNEQQDDDLVINLVELTLTKPQPDRETYLREACGSNQELFEQVWHYVQWEDRMGRFLLDPLIPSPVESHFEPGELLENRFRILREVAQGGMGIVYEAVDEKLDRRIAIKCAKSGFHKRLPPEVRHASEISHPNVCKIFEIHTATTNRGEIDFLTMEFLEGETLADILRRGKLPRENALLIARQVSAGLAEAHRNRVVHGDLKSTNVIVTKGPDGATRAVITDFGLARRPETSQSSLPSESEPGGTPDYMAPELWKGAKASATSDVFALGVLLYELASGQRPYPRELSWEQRLRFKPPLVDPKWDKLLARCLDSDPARRFFDAVEVAQTLEPAHSRRWFLVVAAAVVLAIGTGVVTYLRTATPRESVRLAVLPFRASPETAVLAHTLIPEAAAQIARLSPGTRIRLKVIDPSDDQRKGATHVLDGAFEKHDGKTILHAYMTDLKTGVHAKEQSAEYAPGETRYIPVALAGMITETFHLPALTQLAAVNSSAAKDYWAGLYYIRKNSTVDTGLPLLQRAVAADPDSPLTHAALAEGEWWEYAIRDDRERLARSAESLRQAELRNRDLAPVHRVAGLHKWDQGWYQQAEQEFRRAIELDPANGDAYRWLGSALESNNQLADALAAYLKANEVAPNDYRNPSGLAGYYYNQANYAEAAKFYGKAVELEPKEPVTHFALGATYSDLGRLPEAEAELRTSISLGETPTALHSLGAVLIYEGKYKDAISYISRALDKSPERYLWWTNLGTAYRHVENRAASQHAYKRGLELAEAEMKRNPREGRVKAILAYLYARVGQTHAAESEVAQALNESGSDADTRFWSVLTYDALNNRDNAIAVLKTSPVAVLEDAGRFPDLADLRRDSRFQDLKASHQLK
jgi:tetratricopeptide (TPR) repeat protein